MEAFLNSLASDPLYYIGLILSVLGAVGVVLFLAGFGSESRYVWNNSGHIEHRAHARTRIFWGAFLAGACLAVWEILRFFTGAVPPSVLIFCVLLLCPVWIPWLSKLIESAGKGKKSGGGGH